MRGSTCFYWEKGAQAFLTQIKQRGALLAKGRLLGIQFETLFTDNLYFDISRHAIDMAEYLKEGFRKKGYTFFLESPTNQQFIILENDEMTRLQEKVKFSFWEFSLTVCLRMISIFESAVMRLRWQSF